MNKRFNFDFILVLFIALQLLFSDVYGKSIPLLDNSANCQLLNVKKIQELQGRKIYQHQLQNGLRIYVLENHHLPVFALRLVFDVGAGHESDGESGYAHLFEHMMFKGSKNVPDGDHFAAIKSIGGNVNASTDYDRTDYWTEAPGEFLDRVLWLEAERLKHLAITQANLDNQRQAVLEEKLLRIDNVPYYKTASEFMVSAWQGTPYDHLIIGTEEEIKSATVDKVDSFFKRYYRPDNAILTLVGDIDPEIAIEKIAYYFSDIGQTHPVKMKAVSARSGTMKTGVFEGRSETKFDPLAPFHLYALGWHTVGKNNSDFYAVELLADILLNHDSSRIKKQLKDELELVFETIGFPLTFEKAGITAMGMVPHSYADFAQIKSVIRKELDRIRLEGVTEAELCSAKKHRQLLILKKMSNNRQLAELIGDGALFFDDPWHAISALNTYKQVDNNEIMLVANKYFHDDWLALEITPGPGVRLLKWLMEILPQSFSKTVERQFL